MANLGLAYVVWIYVCNFIFKYSQIQTKPYQTKPNQISWYGIVRHGLDQDENFEPVLPLRIFEISAFLSHFLGKKQKKLDLTHFQMEFQPMQGA